MAKKQVFKIAKIIAYCIGFPLMILMLILSMTPLLNNSGVMGDYARNWILIIASLWIGLEIVRFVLRKYVGKKSETNRKIVIGVMAALSILVVMLPTTIYEAVTKSQYNEVREELAKEGVTVQSYDSLTGWAESMTTDGSDATRALIAKMDNFITMYGLSGLYTTWYDNADKESGLGKKIGAYDKLDELIAAKTPAKAKYIAAKAELGAIESAIAAKLTVYENAKSAYEAALASGAANVAALREKMVAASEAYDKIVQENAGNLVRLKGARLDLTKYKEPLANLLITMAKDPNLLPDGLDIEVAGIKLPIGNLLRIIIKMANITPETVMNLIPDVIYTGIGAKTVATYEKAVNGSANDMSAVALQQFDCELTWNPAILAGARLKYISYIFVGIILFSLVATEAFSQKEEKENGGSNE